MIDSTSYVTFIEEGTQATSTDTNTQNALATTQNTLETTYPNNTWHPLLSSSLTSTTPEGQFTSY